MRWPLIALMLGAACGKGGPGRLDAGIMTLDPDITIQLCRETYDYCQPSPVGLRCYTVCEPNP